MRFQFNKLTSVFLCVCPLVDDKLRPNIVKVAVEQRAAPICCYSGDPGLITGSSNLIWSQQENFAFILGVYLVA